MISVAFRAGFVYSTPPMTDTLEINAALVKEIFRRIDYLYTRLSSLRQLHGLLSDCFKMDKATQNARIELALQRLKNLETAILPDFAADMEQISKLVGHDDEPGKCTTLDFREEPLVRIGPDGPPWKSTKSS